MDRRGKLKAVRKVREARDRQHAIYLEPPPTMSGWIAIADFHTHDFVTGPSIDSPEGPGDVTLNNRRGIPGLILGTDVLTKDDYWTPYGPERGFWGYGLPARCK